MSGRHSATVVPTMKNTVHNIKTKIESNHRIWLKLILSALIPFTIGIITIVLTLIQQQLAFKQRDQDKHDASALREQLNHQADNLQKETILVNYLHDVSSILMSENNSRTKILIHIRTKTLTSLRQLDSERKRHLFLFLYESELIYQEPLQQFPLLKINGADFNDIYFNGTNENKCTFIRIHLYDIYLSNSKFINCYIDRSNFSYSIMHKTIFHKGLLIRLSFRFTLLNSSSFSNTKLSLVNFSGALLAQSNFTGSVWENASVDFTNTYLKGAILSDEQLKNSTLYNSMLPNGTWGPIQKQNLVTNGDLQQNCTSNDGHLLNGWSVGNEGEIRVFPVQNDNFTNVSSKCYFRAISFNITKNYAYAIQTINLENFTLLISSGNARYNASATFQCIGKQYATMIIRFIDVNGLRDAGVNRGTERGTHMQSLKFSNIIRSDTRSVQITITIFRSNDKNDANATIEDNYCACYNIYFSIMKV